MVDMDDSMVVILTSLISTIKDIPAIKVKPTFTSILAHGYRSENKVIERLHYVEVVDIRSFLAIIFFELMPSILVDHVFVISFPANRTPLWLGSMDIPQPTSMGLG